MPQRISESLELEKIEDDYFVICSKCKKTLCSLSENYKYSAYYAEYPLSKAGPEYFYRPSDKFILREYYCPKCGVLFEVEMVPKNIPPIWNIELSTPI